jgi:hypothetical protein
MPISSLYHVDEFEPHEYTQLMEEMDRRAARVNLADLSPPDQLEGNFCDIAEVVFALAHAVQDATDPRLDIECKACGYHDAAPRSFAEAMNASPNCNETWLGSMFGHRHARHHRAILERLSISPPPILTKK